MSNPALDKIRKLLRLAKSANQHEAALAMMRAQELAAKHRVALDSINPDDTDHWVTHQSSCPWTRLPPEARYAALIVQRFFRLKYFICHRIAKQRIVFVGLRHDVEIGFYIYNFLVAHFRRSWNKRTNRRLRKRHDFILGMCNGIWQKLFESESSSDPAKDTAIMATFSEYIDVHFGQLTQSKRKPAPRISAAARTAGYRAGLNTNIHPAIKRETPALTS